MLLDMTNNLPPLSNAAHRAGYNRVVDDGACYKIVSDVNPNLPAYYVDKQTYNTDHAPLWECREKSQFAPTHSRAKGTRGGGRGGNRRAEAKVKTRKLYRRRR